MITADSLPNSRVSNIGYLIDKPLLQLISIALVFLIISCLSSALADQKAPHESQPRFGGQRGIGVVQPFLFPKMREGASVSYLQNPYAKTWAEAMPAARLQELKRAGFDFIRIAIDPGPLLAADKAQEKLLLAEISAALDHTIAHGIKALVDIHPSTSHVAWNFRRLTASPDAPEFVRLIEVARSLAKMLRGYAPEQVALEVLNEPPPPCRWRDRPEWPTLLESLHRQVRDVAPDLTLLAGGACWNAIEGLLQLDPAKFDANTIFVFHFYEPFVFTHQGFWGSEKYLEFVAPLEFPPNAAQKSQTIENVLGRIARSSLSDADKKEQQRIARRELLRYFDRNQGLGFITARFDMVRKWAERHDVAPGRIMLGEFGAMKDIYGKKGAPPQDRARWIATTRMAAEQNGFRWSAWALTNTMGMVTGDLDGPLDSNMLEALGLKAP